jgi:hypothetical protein
MIVMGIPKSHKYVPIPGIKNWGSFLQIISAAIDGGQQGLSTALHVKYQAQSLLGRQG